MGPTAAVKQADDATARAPAEAQGRADAEERARVQAEAEKAEKAEEAEEAPTQKAAAAMVPPAPVAAAAKPSSLQPGVLAPLLSWALASARSGFRASSAPNSAVVAP